VIVLDISTRAFERLPSAFGGSAVRGDGTDEDVLRRAGIEGADVFLALTEGDNRNVMAAQLAVEAFEVPRVIAKINDPVRSAAYAELGIGTLCRTGLMVDAMNAHLGFPPSGLAGMLAPSGHHPGGDHHPLPQSLTTRRPKRPACCRRRPARRWRPDRVRAGGGWWQGRVLPGQGSYSTRATRWPSMEKEPDSCPADR
jgi:trk system potassium uptake protein TrkA